MSEHASGAAPSAIVTDEWDGKRLDAITKAAFELSWNRARDWIARGKIFVDEVAITDIGFNPPLGAAITLRLDAAIQRPGELIKKEDILYIDRHLVVVRKPSGLLSVPFQEDDKETLDRMLRLLVSRIDKKPSGGKRRGAPELHVVHRLDKATSGVMVFARTAQTRDALSAQFRDHSILRRYVALAHGQVEATTYSSHLVIDRGDGVRGSIENSPSQWRNKMTGGKHAVTHVKPLEALRAATLVECRLETGRTNQIRIHLSEAGFPIVGETVYMRDFQGKEIASPRLMLHAAELGFYHTAIKRDVHFEEPIPPDMKALIKQLRPSS